MIPPKSAATPAQRGPWWHFWAENSRWLIASIVLAFGLWMVAVLQTDPITEERFSQAIPVQVLTDGNMLVTNNNTTSVQVTIRAPRSVLANLRADQIDVLADVRGAESGNHRVNLEARLADGLRGQVVDISPRRIDLSLEQIATRSLEVRPFVTQDPPSGFTYSQIRCTPGSVNASGPLSQIEGALAIARVNLSNYRSPTTLNVTLQITTQAGRPITGLNLETSLADCEIDINPIAGVSELSVVPGVEGFPPSGYIYEGYDFRPRTVVVTGDPRAIRELNGIIPTETIQLSGVRQSFEQVVPLILPEGVELLPQSQTITVEIKIGTVQGNRQYSDVPLQATGLGPNLQVEFLPTSVTVFVVGPQPILAELSAEELRVVVDMSGQGAGTYQRTATAQALIETNTPLQLSVQPTEINVTVRDLSITPSPSP